MAFGGALALCGDTLVVGAAGDDAADPQNSGCESGRAYIFRYNGSDWILEKKLPEPTPFECGASFGHAVSCDGDRVAITARRAPGPVAAAVYVYRHNAMTADWDLADTIVEPGPPFGEANFGQSVSMSGDVLVVGANPTVFVENVADQWIQEGAPPLPGLAGETEIAVSVSGDWIIVGAPEFDEGVPGGVDRGAVWVLLRLGTSTQIHQMHRWPLTAIPGDRFFGSSVAIRGDRFVAGAPEFQFGTGASAKNDAGLAYAFRRDDFGTPLDLTDDLWIPEGSSRDDNGTPLDPTDDSWIDVNMQAITALVPDVFKMFGTSVAIEGDTIIMGEPSITGTGAAYAFDLTVPASSPSCSAVDADLDGRDDPEDNCCEVANVDQFDSNLDGFGNLCDTDVDNNGAGGGSDFALWIAAFGQRSPGPPFNPDLDFDNNGGIGGSDFSIWAKSFGDSPGPSGLACAGESMPCVAP